MPNRLRNTVIVIVTIVWAANFLAPLFIDGYMVNAELNIAFMAILGIVTATSSKRDDES